MLKKLKLLYLAWKLCTLLSNKQRQHLANKLLTKWYDRKFTELYGDTSIVLIESKNIKALKVAKQNCIQEHCDEKNVVTFLYKWY